MTKQRLLLFIISFLTLAVALEAVTPVLATTETRYMTSTRSDLVTTPLLYVLSTTQTGSGAQALDGQYDGNVYVTVYFGIRVYLNHSDKSLTEITSAVTTITSGNVTGIVSGTWNCPQTTTVSTDKVQVRVYLSDTNPPGDLQVMAQFVTEALSTTVLNSATWTLYFYLGRQYVARPVPLTKYSFWFGSATYNSRIEGFKYGESSGNAYVADLSKALTSTWTLATLTSFRITPTQSLTSSWSVNLLHGMTTDLAENLVTSWEVVTQTEFRTDFSQSLTSTWDFVTQSTFNLDLVSDWVTSWSTTLQSVFSTTLGFDAVTSWLVDVGQGLSYAVDLGLTVTTSWIADVVIEGSEAFLFFELWMDVLWIPLVASPFLLALWLSRRREEDE